MTKILCTILTLGTLLVIPACYQVDRPSQFYCSSRYPDCPEGRVCRNSTCVPREQADLGPGQDLVPDMIADLLPADCPPAEGTVPDGQRPDQRPGDGPRPEGFPPDLLPDGAPDLTFVPGTWIPIQAGSFLMGSPAGELCRSTTVGAQETQHQVTLTHSFEITNTEVTQAQFAAVMGYNPATKCATAQTCPVNSVSWTEAAAYCNKLNKNAADQCYDCQQPDGSNLQCQVKTSFDGPSIYKCPGYRLPTEAEWEYAYRAKTTTAFYIGIITLCSGNDPNASLIGWYYSNSGNSSQPVGQKQPNAWGLADMAGNLTEWMHDWYQEDLGSSPATDPVGQRAVPTSAYYYSKVLRGGGYLHEPKWLRAAARIMDDLFFTRNWSGFRCARSL